MHFWQIEKFKKELSIQKPIQKDMFFYYLGMGFFWSFFAGLPVEIYQTISYKWIDWSVFLLTTLIAITGSYYVNGGDKGRDFLERYIAIDFVMNIRYFIFALLAGALLGVVSNTESDRNSLILNIIFYCLFTFKNITNIKEISNLQEEKNNG